MTTFIYPEYFYDDNSEPYIKEMELTTDIIKDTIREFINTQHIFIYGAKPNSQYLETLVEGFILFNMFRNKDMIKNKNALIAYVNNKSISMDEKLYFVDIFLFIHKPTFLTKNEHEYIRECGNLDGYVF